MRMHMAAGLTYIGTILLAFGIVIAVIQLLAGQYGTRHPTGVMLAVVLLIGGGVLAGAGTLMKRSRQAG